MRVLLAHAEPAGARALAYLLRCNNMTVDLAGRGDDAIDVARRYDFDVLLMDDRLPDMGDVAAVRRMRAAGVKTPALVMSGAGPQDRVRAFDVGADDVLPKPFADDELVARVRTIVRRSKGFSEPVLRAGPLTLNLNTKEVSVNGEAVRLTRKEYAILEMLVLRRGSLVSRDALMSQLYGDTDEPEVKIIDVFVCKLRKKLAQSGSGGVVATAWGRGYMIRREDDADFAASAGTSSGIGAAETPLSWSDGSPLGGAAAA